MFVFKNNTISETQYQSTEFTNRKLDYFCVNKTLHLCEFTRLQTNRSVTYREIVSLNEMMKDGIYRFNVQDDNKYRHALLFTRFTNEDLNSKLKELGLNLIEVLTKVNINRVDKPRPSSMIEIVDESVTNLVGGNRKTLKSKKKSKRKN